MGGKGEIWVFGDWRNYFQNRVTLQLLARARELAEPAGLGVAAVVTGHDVDEWVGEYIAHGAHRVYVYDHPSLAAYQAEVYTALLVGLIRAHQPQAVLVGATGFGKELAARAAAQLGVGLTADCVALTLEPDGSLVQTAPSFGGSLLAEIVSTASPQMATVRPGTFAERPHDYDAAGEVMRLELPEGLPAERARLVSSQRVEHRDQELSKARVVVVGGRGMGSKKRFARLYELAKLLGGEVGATRPVVYAGWAPEEALVGQAGKHIKPAVLLSFGVSGAIQHTAGISEAKFVVAVNKNPEAAMMRLADVGIAADASQTVTALIRELTNRLRT